MRTCTSKILSIAYNLSTVRRTPGVSAISKNEFTIGFWFGDVKCDVKVLQYIWIRKKHPKHQAPAATRTTNRSEKHLCPLVKNNDHICTLKFC